MFKFSLTQILVASVLVGTIGFMKYQSSRIDTLKLDLTTIEETAKTQSLQLEQLSNDFKSLKKVDDKRAENREIRDKSDQKMNKDAKRSNIVAAKPMLVEKQINDSFNKLAQDMQEATR